MDKEEENLWSMIQYILYTVLYVHKEIFEKQPNQILKLMNGVKCKMGQNSGLGICSLFSRANRAFFQVWIALVPLFVKSNGAIRSHPSSKKRDEKDSLFCFQHKNWKRLVKITNLKWINLNKKKLLFHKERIAPVTLYFKTTFSPVAL